MTVSQIYLTFNIQNLYFIIRLTVENAHLINHLWRYYGSMKLWGVLRLHFPPDTQQFYFYFTLTHGIWLLSFITILWQPLRPLSTSCHLVTPCIEAANSLAYFTDSTLIIYQSVQLKYTQSTRKVVCAFVGKINCLC